VRVEVLDPPALCGRGRGVQAFAIWCWIAESSAALRPVPITITGTVGGSVDRAFIVLAARTIRGG
jgi:hypothetical protein